MHCIEAFLGADEPTAAVCAAWGIRRLELADGLWIVPLDEIDVALATGDADFEWPYIEDLEGPGELRPAVEALLAALPAAARDATLGFIVSAYTGGAGVQAAAVLAGGTVLDGPHLGDGAVNMALRALGVARDDERDEWDVVGLSRWQRTREMIDLAEAAEGDSV
jgi:hypothetical protein